MSIYDLATLADQLAELYPTVDDARRILTLAGFNTVEIEYSSRPRDNWWNILQAAAYRKGALRMLLELVMKDQPENKLIPVLLKEILQFDTASKEDNSNGGPETKRKRLIKVFEQFLESLGDKKGSKGLLITSPKSEKDLKWFQQIMGISQAVGLIKTPNAITSAILLRDGYVLTFFLNATPESIKNTQLILQYDSDDQQLNQPHNFVLDPSFIHNNENLHYTLLRRADHDTNYQIHIPVSSWDHCVGEEVNLISYPMGMPKRISGGVITREQGHELFYTTDIAAGSAGGPVIRNNRVVAMHIGPKDLITQTDEGLKFGIKIEDILKDAGLPLENFIN